MAAKIRHALTVPLAIGSFVSVFYAIAKLMAFLSLPSYIPIQQIWMDNLLDDRSRFEKTLLPITIDAILTVVFILLHSFLRSDIVNDIWNKIGLSSASRSIYNLMTSASILVLVYKWEHVRSVTFWHFNVESNQTIYYLYFVVHTIAWIIIYGGSIVMDLPELIGVKQVYYDWNNLLPPLNYKSRDLVRLYEHVRHPSFFGLAIILWFTNIMSLDRLLLATLWTLYMFIAWKTDASDVAYQQNQLQRKKAELSK